MLIGLGVVIIFAVVILIVLDGLEKRPLQAGMKSLEAMVPARDGVKLHSYVFFPETVPEEGLPVILERDPYDKETDLFGKMFIKNTFKTFTRRGYIYVYQACRGTKKSEGVFDPYNEIADGQDTVDWILQQPWSNGIIGTLGGSYPGYTALAAAVDRPEVKLVVADDMPVRPEDFPARGGFFQFKFFWYHYVLKSHFPEKKTVQAALESLDKHTLDTRLLGKTSDFWQGFLAAESSDDAFWLTHSLTPYIQDISAVVVSPIALKRNEYVWQDDVPYLFQQLKESGNDKMRMILTQEGHCDHLIFGFETPLNRLILEYFDRHLKGDAAIDLSGVPAVLTKVQGEKQYMKAERWPFHDIEKTLYLSSGHSLLGQAPQEIASGHVMLEPERMDLRSYPERHFISQPFQEDTYLIGHPKIDLYMQSSAKDFDVYVGLYETKEEFSEKTEVPYEEFLSYAAIRAKYRHGFGREELVEPDDVIRIVLEGDPIARKIAKGSRVGIVIRHAQQWSAENPLSGEPVHRQTHYRTANITLYHGGSYPSQIVLPVFSGQPEYFDFQKRE